MQDTMQDTMQVTVQATVQVTEQVTKSKPKYFFSKQPLHFQLLFLYLQHNSCKYTC
jgi:hypothetical protein